MTAQKVKQSLKNISSKYRKEKNEYFFKTDKGQYGEGDKFIGVSVPDQRKVAKEYKDLSLNELQKLLDSEIHEHRLTALLILVLKYQDTKKKSIKKILKSKELKKERKEIVDFYLKNTKKINNWDLVDLSAPYILGDYVHETGYNLLFPLARAKDLWKNRIAILATFTFIKNGNFNATLKIAEMYLSHHHDLIHKAVGWMLREVGKKDKTALVNFIKENYEKIPRTTLRYSIEKFPEKERKKYLKGDLKDV